jgi:hypothetical protein
MSNLAKQQKRGPGRPPIEDPMRQIAVRLHGWMLDELDEVNQRERHGQADRATLIREAVAFWLSNHRRRA